MRELLERWAKLEPKRCALWTGVAWVTIGQRDEGVTLPDPSPSNLGHLLAAVIEAIEARGWWWKLHRYGTWPHLVRGHVGPDPLSAVPRLGEGPTPAAALLTAYLAALETETNQ